MENSNPSGEIFSLLHFIIHFCCRSDPLYLLQQAIFGLKLNSMYHECFRGLHFMRLKYGKLSLVGKNFLYQTFEFYFFMEALYFTFYNWQFLFWIEIPCILIFKGVMLNKTTRMKKPSLVEKIFLYSLFHFISAVEVLYFTSHN